jgi:hypothetical protein
MKKETNKSLKFIVIYILSILIVIISASIFSERMVMAVADTSKVIIQHAVNASGGAIAPQHTGHYVPHEIYEKKQLESKISKLLDEINNNLKDLEIELNDQKKKKKNMEILKEKKKR